MREKRISNFKARSQWSPSLFRHGCSNFRGHIAGQTYVTSIGSFRFCRRRRQRSNRRRATSCTHILRRWRVDALGAAWNKGLQNQNSKRYGSDERSIVLSGADFCYSPFRHEPRHLIALSLRKVSTFTARSIGMYTVGVHKGGTRKDGTITGPTRIMDTCAHDLSVLYPTNNIVKSCSGFRYVIRIAKLLMCVTGFDTKRPIREENLPIHHCLSFTLHFGKPEKCVSFSTWRAQGWIEHLGRQAPAGL